ncbi:unnamed protein product [Lactuca saligna]|uniref:Uncharacterized protein n=1 Tax=Lactuca saligna TaxID=75948 RepID=A0AA36EI25_LACSI|nr:unnamed protein product [Lactuca saligna]
MPSLTVEIVSISGGNRVLLHSLFLISLKSHRRCGDFFGYGSRSPKGPPLSLLDLTTPILTTADVGKSASVHGGTTITFQIRDNMIACLVYQTSLIVSITHFERLIYKWSLN